MKPTESVSNLIAKLSALRDGHKLAVRSYEYIIADLQDHSSFIEQDMVNDNLEENVKKAIRKSKKIKKLHWTQTLGGKKKMARIQKKVWKQRKAAAK
jgi:hypothetical protein